jgi:hypothetical protein
MARLSVQPLSQKLKMRWDLMVQASSTTLSHHADRYSDDLLERTEKVVSYDEPLDVHITSLQNWLRGNSCIAQDEMSFLQMKDDLLVLAPLEDGVLYWLETAVTSIIGFFSNVSSRNPSQSRK